LMTIKRNDFQIFKKICEEVAQMKHLNPQFLKEIIRLAFRMNGSGKRKYSEAELLRVLDKMKI